MRRAVKMLDDVVYRLIAEGRARGTDRGDVLSMLLLARDEEDGSGLTDAQVRDEVMTLLLAGHETTANALTWTWYELGTQPRRARAPRRPRSTRVGERPITAEDLPALPWNARGARGGDAPAPARVHDRPRRRTSRGRARRSSAAREARSSRSTSAASTAAPTTTRPRSRSAPERMLPDAKKARPRHHYLPFGAGPRVCIGCALRAARRRSSRSRRWCSTRRSGRSHATSSPSRSSRCARAAACRRSSQSARQKRARCSGAGRSHDFGAAPHAIADRRDQPIAEIEQDPGNQRNAYAQRHGARRCRDTCRNALLRRYARSPSTSTTVDSASGMSRMLRAQRRGGRALERREPELVIALVTEQPAHRAMAQTTVAVVEDDRSRGDCGLEFLDGSHVLIMPRSETLSLRLAQ